MIFVSGVAASNLVVELFFGSMSCVLKKGLNIFIMIYVPLPIKANETKRPRFRFQEDFLASFILR